MDGAAVQATIEATRALKQRQETPDPPEALECIPSLQLADIPKNIITVPTALASEHGATILTHDLFTPDVLYLEATLDMRGVPAALLPLMPLFCR
jgi:Zn-dependent M16 (insulinase) family peptidase